MNKKVRFTYVTGVNPHIIATPVETEVPLWTLSALREGIDYILGTHAADSDEAKALLAAYRLAESAK